MPEETIDPVVVGAGLVQQLQNVVSRNLRPSEAAVLSVTEFHAGRSWNVIPDRAMLSGTVRVLSEGARDLVEQGLRRACNGAALASGASVDVSYHRGHPATVNTPREAALAESVMRELAGAAALHTDLPASMAAEDFGEMLEVVPGAYAWLGSGKGADTPLLHSPRFDFNDDVLVLGAGYWVALVEKVLAR